MIMKQDVSTAVSLATIILVCMTLSHFSVSHRILVLETIPMETKLIYFLKECLSYFSENGFVRHDFCERSLSPQNDNKSEIKVEFILFSLFLLLCKTTLSPMQLFEEGSFNFHWFIFYIFKNPVCARGGQSFTESAWLKYRNTPMAFALVTAWWRHWWDTISRATFIFSINSKSVQTSLRINTPPSPSQ